MEIRPLIPIGAQIKVEKSKIESLIPNKSLDNLPQIINGEVIDYKMTDGMGIGYVLITENNQKFWIFNSELNDLTKTKYKIYDPNNSTDGITKLIASRINNLEYEISGNKGIKTVANPINLISWLIFTLKDIF